MKRIGLGLFLLTLLATAVPLVAAKPHTAVSLAYFHGNEAQDGVHLEWGTGSEIDTVAFFLRRSSGAAFSDLTELYDANGNLYPGGIIAAEGQPALGSDYIAIDRTAVLNTTYTYQLMEIEDDNSVELLGTIIVATGATATPTLQIINTVSAGATSTSNNGNNSAATATPTTISANNNANPTNTPVAPATVARQNNTPAAATAVNTNPVSDNDNNSNTLASNTNLQVPDNTTREAQEDAEQVQVTVSAYPGAAPTETSPANDASYPAQPPVLPAAETATPYPADFDSQNQPPTPTIIAVIGANSSNDSASAVTSAPVQSSASSLSVLWGGFLLAMIVFTAAVIGSIMIFVRKRS